MKPAAPSTFLGTGWWHARRGLPAGAVAADLWRQTFRLRLIVVRPVSRAYDASVCVRRLRGSRPGWSRRCRCHREPDVREVGEEVDALIVRRQRRSVSTSPVLGTLPTEWGSTASALPPTTEGMAPTRCYLLGLLPPRISVKTRLPRFGCISPTTPRFASKEAETPAPPESGRDWLPGH
jgi:hypothetical protein